MPVTYICLAAYNEEQDLPRLLTAIGQLPAGEYEYRVIAYNDGSTDATQTILERFSQSMPLIILGGAENRGLGYGINCLIEKLCAVSENESDIGVFCDADNSHDPETIRPMQQKIAAGADMVIASRFQPGSKIHGFPFYRRCLSFAASCYFRLILPLNGVRDYTSGYRAYRASTLKKVRQRYGDALVTETSFSCQVELLSRLAPLAKIEEVPMTYYYDRKLGGSKLKLFKTIRRTLLVGARIALRRDRFDGR